MIISVHAEKLFEKIQYLVLIKTQQPRKRRELA